MRRNGARSRRAGRLERWDAEQTDWARPQWSPLSTSGATCQERYRERDCQAAMEPALDERGDAERQLPGVAELVAAMEPALDERGDAAKALAAVFSQAAAMEPALDERGDLKPVSAATSSRVPQWSPLSTSGATDHVPAKVDLTNDAAMEPALDERGDPNGRRRR